MAPPKGYRNGLSYKIFNYKFHKPDYYYLTKLFWIFSIHFITFWKPGLTIVALDAQKAMPLHIFIKKTIILNPGSYLF